MPTQETRAKRLLSQAHGGFPQSVHEVGIGGVPLDAGGWHCNGLGSLLQDALATAVQNQGIPLGRGRWYNALRQSSRWRP